MTTVFEIVDERLAHASCIPLRLRLHRSGEAEVSLRLIVDPDPDPAPDSRRYQSHPKLFFFSRSPEFRRPTS